MSKESPVDVSALVTERALWWSMRQEYGDYS